MTDDKTPRECICHASWSGYNEQEWMARGCPKCECWKVDAYDALAKENEELKNEDNRKKLYDCRKEIGEANAKIKSLRESLKLAATVLKKTNGYMFVLCQPNNGELFAEWDDIVREALAAMQVSMGNYDNGL